MLGDSYQNKGQFKAAGEEQNKRTWLWQKKSLWTTTAAKIGKEGNKFTFSCVVCKNHGIVNRSISSSNVINHYKTRHQEVYENIIRLNESNAGEDIVLDVIAAARESCRLHNRQNSISKYLTGSIENSHDRISAKTLQTTAAVMYGCVTETPLMRIGSPIF